MRSPLRWPLKFCLINAVKYRVILRNSRRARTALTTCLWLPINDWNSPLQSSLRNRCRQWSEIQKTHDPRPTTHDPRSPHRPINYKLQTSNLLKYDRIDERTHRLLKRYYYGEGRRQDQGDIGWIALGGYSWIALGVRPVRGHSFSLVDGRRKGSGRLDGIGRRRLL